MIEQQDQILTLRDNAKAQLMQIKTIDSGVRYLNKVKAFEIWLKAEKKDGELQNVVAEQKIRTQKVLGKLIKQGKKNGEISTKEDNLKRHHTEVTSNDFDKKSLSDLGVTRNESSTWQQIDDIPDEIFEQEIAEKKEKKKELTTDGMLQKAKKHKKQSDRSQRAEAGKDLVIDVDFRLGDFEQVLEDIPDGSVDCIITDPPYPYEFIECWTKLSRFAAKKLKPNGYCIAYSGIMFLPEVLNRMNENLDYYWTFVLYHVGQTQIVNGVNLIGRWKPILIYQNGKKKLSNTVQDYILSEQPEKGSHDWQQSLSGISKLIEYFTKEGELIVDPFAGGGTTIKAALTMKRNIIAAEIDETTYNIAKERLYDKG